VPLALPSAPPDDLLKRLRASVASYHATLVTEADGRLYVRPLLEAGDLLQLHVRHCYAHAHGQAPAHPLALGRILGVSEQRVRQIDARCRAAGALDDRSNLTTTIGRVAVSVVQYVHHQWVDDHFADVLASASPRVQIALKHPDEASCLPRLYAHVVELLARLDEALDDASMAMFLLAIDAFVAEHGRSPKPAELSVAMGVSSKTTYERARAARSAGLLTRVDLDMTRAGRQHCEKTRTVIDLWTREAALAMTGWSSARAS
jgi:hypothetical protein